MVLGGAILITLVVIALLLFLLAGNARLVPSTSIILLGLATFIIVAYHSRPGGNSAERAGSAENYRRQLRQMSRFELAQELINKADYTYLRDQGANLRKGLTDEQVARLDLSRFTPAQRRALLKQMLPLQTPAGK